MDEPLRIISNLRLPMAALASLLAAWICDRQKHVHIVFSDPSTYDSPLHHRCGLLLVACLSWALGELTLLPMLRR